MTKIPTPDEAEAAMLEGFRGAQEDPPTPAYVFDILEALKAEAPLNFHGHAVPGDVQVWCAANLTPVRDTE